MTHAQEVGDRIAQARREKGVRERRDVLRAELAEYVGVDPSTITAWEKGQKSPREPALAKLAEFLNVTPAYIRYGIRPTDAAHPDVIVVDGVEWRDVTEDVGGKDAKIAEGARLAREAAKKAAAKRRKSG